MLSPHKQGDGAYEEARPDRVIPPEEERLIMMGYKFLGWNPTSAIPEYRDCYNEGHNYHAIPNTWQDVQHTPNGDDCTFWCMRDKIYWKLDKSDV